ncbi:MAG: fluoride efflux transporter CrcB [Acidimicrobiia bacterium]
MSRRSLVLVACGGAVGAVARYRLQDAFPVGQGAFPWTTFWINVSGAFALGFLLEWAVRKRPDDTWERFLVGIGMLGAYTTFSTLAVEVVQLLRVDHAGTAVAYLGASLVVGPASVIAGLLAAGWRPRELPPEEGES